MQITRETRAYNHRRMGRPWIAVVDFSASAKGEFRFGDWTGDHHNGGAGVLSVDATQGNIIAVGQKDNRQPRKSAPDYYVLSADGRLDPIGDKGDAYKYYLEHKGATTDMDALRTERETLTKRIKEIDAILKGGQDDEKI